MDLLKAEIEDLQKQLNDKQYLKDEYRKHVEEGGITAEEIEIGRLRRESIPQLEEMLGSLQSQIEEQTSLNPDLKYLLSHRNDADKS